MNARLPRQDLFANLGASKAPKKVAEPVKQVTKKPDENNQGVLFEIESWQDEEWKGMPEYTNKEIKPYQDIIVHFKTPEGVQEFARIVGQSITPKMESIFFPKGCFHQETKKVYRDES